MSELTNEEKLRILRAYYKGIRFVENEHGELLGREFMFDGIYNVFTVSDKMLAQAIEGYKGRKTLETE
nr:MAG TPA: hypothetical protein [Bacteriophage sp.]